MPVRSARAGAVQNSVPRAASSAATGLRRRGARARREDGAVAVETAIISLFLVTIVAGIVDVSSLFATGYQVTLAARSGARVASSDPMSPTFAQNAGLQLASAPKGQDPTRVNEIWVYKASTVDGSPVSGASCASQCVRLTLDSNGDVVSSTGSWSGRSACSGGTVDAVGVYVEYAYKAKTWLFDGHPVGSRTVMRLEPQPSSTTCVSS